MRSAIVGAFVLGSMPAGAQPATAQDAFWNSVRGLCGRAFAGAMVEGTAASDAAMAGVPMVMQVRDCRDAEIRIPFHAGDDRSRTWVLTRTATGLRLKHDHRHRDGTRDAVTDYGGDTRDGGTSTRQDFAADESTAALIPAAATNVWSIELKAGESFTYALKREGRRFSARFDLTREVPAPPAPWGE